MLYSVLIESTNNVYITCNPAEAKEYAENGYSVYLNNQQVSADEINENENVHTVFAVTTESQNHMKERT